MPYEPYEPYVPYEPTVPDKPVVPDRKPVPWTAIAVIAVAAIFLLKDKIPSPNPPAPNPAVASIDDIVDIAANDADAAKAAGELFLAMAETVERAKGMSVNSSQLQAWLTDSNTLRFIGTDYVGKLPGFSKAVNDVFVAEIGLESRTLTDADIDAVASICRQVAQSCGVNNGS